MRARRPSCDSCAADGSLIAVAVAPWAIPLRPLVGALDGGMELLVGVSPMPCELLPEPPPDWPRPSVPPEVPLERVPPTAPPTTAAIITSTATAIAIIPHLVRYQGVFLGGGGAETAVDSYGSNSRFGERTGTWAVGVDGAEDELGLPSSSSVTL